MHSAHLCYHKVLMVSIEQSVIFAKLLIFIQFMIHNSEKKDFKILYIDDEVQNLTAFRAVFRREYTIFTANSANEGFYVLRNDDIHLIISDQRMPDMTGVEFFEKTLPEYPDIIRMVLTGYSDVGAIIAAINNGRVFRYITKPWNEGELRMTIENARQLYSLNKRNLMLVSELKQKVEEQEKILRLFMRYVPEPVIEKALQSTEDTILAGELRNVTVLFCDIREFTPLSEKMSPKEVVAFLNDYYALMTSCIKKHNGFVNQFVGDEIFASFGAPVDYPDNEANAVFCALDMIQNLELFNQKYCVNLEQEIKVGIGINAGEVIAGNLGTEDRIDYSLTGDVVNTGKRIETITKDIPNSIIISQSVYEKTKTLIETKPFEPLFVKGKREKLMVYQVISRKENC